MSTRDTSALLYCDAAPDRKLSAGEMTQLLKWEHVDIAAPRPAVSILVCGLICCFIHMVWDVERRLKRSPAAFLLAVLYQTR